MSIEDLTPAEQQAYYATKLAEVRSSAALNIRVSRAQLDTDIQAAMALLPPEVRRVLDWDGKSAAMSHWPEYADLIRAIKNL